MRNFRELEVWQDARKLVKEIYILTEKLPDTERFGLVPQINKRVISIPANTAEGCAKYSQKDFVRFLQISLGSAYELESHLILYGDLNFIESGSISSAIQNTQLLQRRIASLIKYNNSR